MDVRRHQLKLFIARTPVLSDTIVCKYDISCSNIRCHIAVYDRNRIRFHPIITSELLLTDCVLYLARNGVALHGAKFEVPFLSCLYLVCMIHICLSVSFLCGQL